VVYTMKALLTIALALSIYDVQGQPNFVRVELCDRTCVSVVTTREALKDGEAFEALTRFLLTKRDNLN
jgi:hypothetical protein